MNSSEIHPLPNARDKAALKAIAATLIPACPSLQDVAHEVASDLLIRRGLQGIDPDQVYFHRFKTSQSSAKSFTGWEHPFEKPYESMTLTQLVIHRFRVTDKDNADLLDLYSGFYSAGPDAESFDDTNEVRLHGNEVLKAFWDLDFSTLYRERLAHFWRTSSDDFRTLAKCNFLSCAVQALEQKQLSGDDFQRLIDSVIGPISWPVSLKMLKTMHPAGNDVRALDIAGHVATNLIRIVDPGGRQIVYLPGEVQAFHVMDSEADMHWWILQQMNENAPRSTFLDHFPLSDRHEIEENISDIMNRLVSSWGKADHRLINQTNQAIKGDAFNWLRESTRSAMSADASLSLTSNGELRKKLWIGYFSAGLKVFGPMAAVGWPVALPVIGASIASMGLNIDQAVNGKTAADRKQGVIGAVLNGIDALFNVPFLKGTGATLEIGAQVEAAEAAEMAELTEFFEPAEADWQTGVKPEVNTPVESDRVPVNIAEPATVEPATNAPPEVPSRYQCNEILDDGSVVNESGKFEGIHRLDSDPSYAILLDDNAYYVRYFKDSRGGGYWAIVDPERPNQFAHSLPVRLNAEGRWERMRALRLNGGGQCMGKGCTATVDVEPDVLPSTDPGMAPQPSSARAVRLVSTNYDLPPRLQTSLRSWALDLSDTEAGVDPYNDTYRAQLNNLIRAAERYLAGAPWANLPPRPVMPVISRAMPMDDLIARIFEAAPGLVVGETFDRITSMRFMIENMPSLARHAKTIYVRRLLNDFAQYELNTFYETGDMSQDLKTYLSGLGTDPAERFDMLQLVKTARDNGVRIQALDCAVSYKAPDRGPQQQLRNNFLADQIMITDRSYNSPGKWVVLSGAENINTFRGIPGISEMQGGIGLRIEEVNPGETSGVDIDPGVEMPGQSFPGDIMMGNSGVLYGDLRLRIPASPVIWSEQKIQTLLINPGYFLFEKTAGNYTLLHRSRLGMIVRTAVQQSADGHFSIHNPNWPDLNDVAFVSLEQMAGKMAPFGLELQSRIPD